MSITPTDALTRCIEHREIFHDEMLSLWRRLMRGELTPVQIAGLLLGLRVKKETIGEIAAAAHIMREFATKVPVADRKHLLDIVGTGGDGSQTFNISTAAMFVAAAAGARVAKHGNRGVSSGSGSADVLEALGAQIALSPVMHDGRGVFAGVPAPFAVTRYHSLAIEQASLPEDLTVTATSDDGEIMGVRHRRHAVEGVQFHPEAILTEHGRRLLANFLEARQ